MIRETQTMVKVFCLNDPDEAAEYSNYLSNPKAEMAVVSENWNPAGLYRIVVIIKLDVDKRPAPSNEDQEESRFKVKDSEWE